MKTVSAAASAARPSGQWAGKKARVAVVQPASRAAGTAGAPRATAGGIAATTDRGRGGHVLGVGRLFAARRRPAASLAAGGRLAGSSESAASTSWASGFGRSGRARRERRRPAADALGDLEERPAAERVPSGERLPEQDAGRPDVRLGPGRLAGEALRARCTRASRERRLRGQRLLLAHQRQAEVEDPNGDVGPVREQDVRRLHVTVDDPAVVRVREPVENLRRGIDRRVVVELAAFERVAERAAWDVLVGDVHMALVAGECVRAQACGVLELRGRSRLALGARTGGARAGNDLQSDLAALPLVECVPDRAHAAASQRLQWAVPVEHEARRSSVNGGLRHSPDTFPVGGRTPFASKEWATVTRIPLQTAL